MQANRITATEIFKATELIRNAMLSEDESTLVSVLKNTHGVMDVLNTTLEGIHNPMHLAAGKGFHKAIPHLVAHGGSPDVRGPWGETPLHAALLSSNSTESVKSTINALLSTGANIDAANLQGITPLLSASEMTKGGEMVSLLLEAGANPNHVSKHGFTALHLAAREGDAGNVRALLKCGADPQVRGPGAASVVDSAADHPETAQIIKEWIQAQQANQSIDDSLNLKGSAKP